MKPNYVNRRPGKKCNSFVTIVCAAASPSDCRWNVAKVKVTKKLQNAPGQKLQIGNNL